MIELERQRDTATIIAGIAITVMAVDALAELAQTAKLLLQ